MSNEKDSVKIDMEQDDRKKDEKDTPIVSLSAVGFKRGIVYTVKVAETLDTAFRFEDEYNLDEVCGLCGHLNCGGIC